jgi:hypothetical protein
MKIIIYSYISEISANFHFILQKMHQIKLKKCFYKKFLKLFHNSMEILILLYFIFNIVIRLSS